MDQDEWEAELLAQLDSSDLPLIIMNANTGEKYKITDVGRYDDRIVMTIENVSQT